MNHRNFVLIFGMVALIFGMAACSEKEEFDESPVFVGSSGNEIILSALGGTYNLEVYSSRDYRVERMDEADWLTLDAGEPVNNVAVIEMKYDANDGFKRMTSFVLISDADETRRDTVVVKQRGGMDPVLRFTDKLLVTLSNEGGNVELPIVTNISAEEMVIDVDYTDEDADDWITGVDIIGNAGNDNRTLSVSFKQNSGSAPRSVTIRFSLPDGWGAGDSVSDEISLLQNDMYGESFHTITFDELRDVYATGERITEYVAIEGIVVSNKDNCNAGQPLMTGLESADFTPTTKTIYFESEDAKYGIAIYADNEDDNIFDQFDRASILLTGMTVSVKSNPTRYELTGFSPSYVYSQESGTEAPVKERSIGSLTDDDFYTYVKLTNVEFPIRKGALSPADGSYNHDNNSQCITKYPILVRDINGDDLFLLTNDLCPYRRDGTRLPYGSGNLYGVVVHEHFSRYEWANGLGFLNDAQVEDVNEEYGNIGRYQLRHQTKEDIWGEMNDDFEDGFSALLCEYRYRVVKQVEDSPYGTAIDVPSYGTNGWLTHTYQRYFTEGKKNFTYTDSTHFSSGSYTYDYLGPCGTSSSAQYGMNYGNKNGLGIIIDTDKEDYTTFETDRFAYNDEGKLEFACQYAENTYSGYGSAGWTSPGDGNVNVPNCGGSNSYRGRGLAMAGIHLDWINHRWWDDDTDRFYGYLLNVSTKEITSSVLSMQIYIRLGQASTYSPLYWCVEWALTDSQAEGDDDKWTSVGEFTVPPAFVFDDKSIYQSPGYKPVNIKLPTDILGYDNVYFRIRPTSDICGDGTDYANARVKDKTGSAEDSQHAISIGYLAIRYNK